MFSILGIALAVAILVVGFFFTDAMQYMILVDRRLQRVNLPPDGILVSSKLTEILRVKPGDALTVKVLEGAKPTRTVPVMGTINETIGLSAYMDIRALNRLMREGETISGALLAVDGDRLAQLYTQLKRTPGVARVALRSVTIQRFQQTITESISIATTTLLIFAAVIAGGVVYNAARIALSERSRELATLRIIGFSRVQIAVVLLGEQAVLTIAAIPIGLIIGWGLAGIIAVGSSSELYRFPVYITRATYALAAIGVAIAALISSLFVRHQLDRLDLIAVLKTRE